MKLQAHLAGTGDEYAGRLRANGRQRLMQDPALLVINRGVSVAVKDQVRRLGLDAVEPDCSDRFITALGLARSPRVTALAVTNASQSRSRLTRPLQLSRAL
jgi:hypothetical protein